MRNSDELALTFFAALVSVSPLAALGCLLAPLEAHRLLQAAARPLSGVL